MYPEPMETLLDLRPRRATLLISPRHKLTRLLVAIAHLAQTSPLTVLDCGRQYDPSIVARAAGGRAEVIDRIQIQRAFTCYEVVKLLEYMPVSGTPIILLDFLSTFYDENVRLGSRKYLLECALRHFQRLGCGAGLVVSAFDPPAAEDAAYFFERLKSAATNILTVEPPAISACQLSLF
jgi:hypothetical protein